MHSIEDFPFGRFHPIQGIGASATVTTTTPRAAPARVVQVVRIVKLFGKVAKTLSELELSSADRRRWLAEGRSAGSVYRSMNTNLRRLRFQNGLQAMN
jgi:hypothetical protein